MSFKPRDSKCPELKLVKSVRSFSRTTGVLTGPNGHCRVRRRGPLVRAAGCRVAKTPAEYRAKARKADAQFVEGGSGRIPNAPNAKPGAKVIAFSAFGEFSSSMNVPIDGFAHEGALKNPGRFGQSNYKAAYRATNWWLKCRWRRLAVITAFASRHDALRYVGDSAQRQAATQHARAQDRDDWRFDGTFGEQARKSFYQGWEARFGA